MIGVSNLPLLGIPNGETAARDCGTHVCAEKGHNASVVGVGGHASVNAVVDGESTALDAYPSLIAYSGPVDLECSCCRSVDVCV